MKILLISGYFPPDVGSAAHLFADLGSEFVRRGHQVTVLTNYPSYNVDVSTLPARYRTGRKMSEEYAGMNIIRTKPLGMPRHIPWLRGLDQVSSAIQFVLAGLASRNQKPDVVLVYSPPLFYGVTALALRAFTGAKVVFNVQDLFPQSAVDLKLLKNGLLIGLFRRLESSVYRRVDHITVHSSGNQAHVEGHGGRGRVTVAANVVDTDAIRPGDRLNEFRRRHGISDSAILFSFAGVLGYSQDLDTVIEAARLLADLPGLLVYIVGDGVEKPRLVEKAAGLRNVRFLPMLPKSEYAELLHASDVGLVTLRAAVQTPVVPSKILSLMAAGRAVLAALPLHGDAPRLIEEAHCGRCVEPENAQALAGAMTALAKDPAALADFGRCGRAYAEEHLTVGASASTYEEIFQTLLHEAH
jgi:glycosyltransferase involved in cell wall biosynthesis